MGLRFRRRVTIVPGLTLNISKSGLGLSAGPRGAKVGVGPRGIHRSVGIPGSGLHYRTETTWGAIRSESGRGGRSAREGGSRARAGSASQVFVQVQDDGRIELVDGEGSPLPPHQARAFRDRNAEWIDGIRAEAAERWNAGIDEILGVHLSTPDPEVELAFEPRSFEAPGPDPFVPEPPGLLGRLWPARREQIERSNEERRRDTEAMLASWQAERDRFETEEARRREDHEVGRHGEVAAMERVLEERLSRMEWPRRTEVSYEIRDAGKGLCLDVDLPEEEEIPREEATPAARGLRLLIRRKSDTQVRREYKRHIHGVLFRIVGEAFHALPALEDVTASGYSTRTDPATGHPRDDYLVSVRIRRRDWRELNFANLEAVDVVAAFERFDLRRRMTKTGIFRPVEPHLEGDGS